MLNSPKADGDHVAIRPVHQRDYQLLYDWAMARTIPWRWSGPSISPEAFQQSIWVDVFAQCIIEDKATGRAIGWVSAYGANLYHGTTFVSVGIVPSERRSGRTLEGCELFFDYLFETVCFRKINFDTDADSLEQMASLTRAGAEHEGRLQDQYRMGDRYVDQHFFGLSRASWTQAKQRIRHPFDTSADTLVSDSFIERLKNVFGDQSSVDFDTPLAVLATDSIACLELICLLEDAAGSELPDGVWQNFAHVGDMWEWIQLRAADRTL